MPEQNKILTEIRSLLAKSPEELKHAKKTLKWLLLIKPDASLTFKIAALGHDIERAITPWKNNDLSLSDEEKKKFREKHAKRSADIIKELLIKNKVLEDDISKVYNLILNHEWGGGKEEDMLRDADSLANFEWCDEYFEREGLENISQIIKRMYLRMA